MSNTNLLEEIKRELAENGKSISDIEWIGTESVMLDLDLEGAESALNIYYDSGYGVEWVNSELKVCGNGWWLERHQYDCQEWWEYKEQPKMPKLKTSDNKKVLIGCFTLINK